MFIFLIAFADLKCVLKNVDYGRMTEILVQRAASPDEFTRLTSITWVRMNKLVIFFLDYDSAI